ncbi:hypothetical protein [Streptomyces decoyicus]|uniref:hypothetical protein n=1 Tax=Streptomyces decoyicus TaxID=249567 RepID=UPI0004AB6A51|nr:hypothetical protein [Streptomyces decoyicus]KOG48713.1 hypothetical protein ADK74_07505 [Streptomyces decoyicus]QZY20247.1 hypothetical protein K7C20_37850 [Streptomyces decoyicus]
MVFNSIFDFAGKSAGFFSVTHGDRTQPTADPDFDFDSDFEEDVTDTTYDDKSTSLSADAIHGASSRAKVVQEQSPEARLIMGFLGAFVQKTQEAAGPTGYTQDLGSVSTAASEGMEQSNAKMANNPDLKKNEDLQNKPDKGKYTGMPKTPAKPAAPEAGKAPKATADKPPGSK